MTAQCWAALAKASPEAGSVRGDGEEPELTSIQTGLLAVDPLATVVGCLWAWDRIR